MSVCLSGLLVGSLHGLSHGVGVPAADATGLLHLLVVQDLDLDTVKEEGNLGRFDLNHLVGGPES